MKKHPLCLIALLLLSTNLLPHQGTLNPFPVLLAPQNSFHIPATSAELKRAEDYSRCMAQERYEREQNSIKEELATRYLKVTIQSLAVGMGATVALRCFRGLYAALPAAIWFGYQELQRQRALEPRKALLANNEKEREILVERYLQEELSRNRFNEYDGIFQFTIQELRRERYNKTFTLLERYRENLNDLPAAVLAAFPSCDCALPEFCKELATISEILDEFANRFSESLVKHDRLEKSDRETIKLYVQEAETMATVAKNACATIRSNGLFYAQLEMQEKRRYEQERRLREEQAARHRRALEFAQYEAALAQKKAEIARTAREQAEIAKIEAEAARTRREKSVAELKEKECQQLREKLEKTQREAERQQIAAQEAQRVAESEAERQHNLAQQSQEAATRAQQELRWLQQVTQPPLAPSAPPAQEEGPPSYEEATGQKF